MNEFSFALFEIRSKLSARKFVPRGSEVLKFAVRIQNLVSCHPSWRSSSWRYVRCHDTCSRDPLLCDTLVSHDKHKHVCSYTWNFLSQLQGNVKFLPDSTNNFLDKILKHEWVTESVRSLGYLWDILGISQGYLGDILRISKGYLKDILEIS